MATRPDGTSVRTEPAEFTKDELRAELLRVRAITPKLEHYQELEFREIPKQLQAQLRELTFLEPPTDSGLERVSGIFWQLLTLRQLIEQLQRGESIAWFWGLGGERREERGESAARATSVAAEPVSTAPQATSTLSLPVETPTPTPSATGASSPATLSITTEPEPASTDGTLVVKDER